jgi:hypothetical protein
LISKTYIDGSSFKSKLLSHFSNFLTPPDFVGDPDRQLIPAQILENGVAQGENKTGLGLPP